MSLVLYYSSVAAKLKDLGSIVINKNQQRIQMVLDGKKIPYKLLDVTQDDDVLKQMRVLSRDPRALPPQLANGSEYCGDYDGFEAALENEELEKFLKLSEQSLDFAFCNRNRFLGVEEMSLVLYYSSVAAKLKDLGSIVINKNQQRIQMVLDGKKIPYKLLDVTQDDDVLKQIRVLSRNPRALPPQLANGNQYCGDYDGFEAALENEELEKFLKLE